MNRVIVYCEGQTEEMFVKRILRKHFDPMEIFLSPIIFRTGKNAKGGVVSYGKIRHQIDNHCKADQNAVITTMIDFYGLPGDFPGAQTLPKTKDPFQKVKYLEQEFKKDIRHSNFIPNMILHEFEGLLFSSLEAFDILPDSQPHIAKLKEEVSNFETPEHINDNADTAPSKRILRHFPGYEKIQDGETIARKIGLTEIRHRCNHFNDWLTKLENVEKK